MPPIPLHGAVFVGRADTLGTSSIAYLRTLAQSLREMGNSFVVVATVSPSGDRTRDQARADRRAAAVKSALVAGGATTVTITTAGRVEVPARNAPAGGITLVKQS
jgi:outer membrane protein OmpA-like peptidoglycan-associated protein